MRGKGFFAVALAVAIAVMVGCQNGDKKRSMIYYKPKEVVVEVPDDPRFNNPPSAEYRARVKPKDEKALIGNKMGGGPGGAGGNPGF
jgi:predicted component of type VI protein secretion system